MAIFLSLCAAVPVKNPRQTEQRPLTFADVIPGSRFPQRGFNGTWMTGNTEKLS